MTATGNKEHSPDTEKPIIRCFEENSGLIQLPVRSELLQGNLTWNYVFIFLRLEKNSDFGE